jgi:hypothetical protein
MRFRSSIISAAALGLMLSAAPASAQWSDVGRIFGGQGRYANSRQIAYDNGYREGLNHGQDAARDRKPFDVQREKDYRKADEGYRKEYGDKDRYRDEFRRGFAEGYRQAYARSDRGGYYGNSYPGTYPNYPQRRDDGRVYGGTYDPRNGHRGGYGYGGYGLQTAYQNGVNDGYQKGQDDAHDRKAPDPRRQKWYRSGDRHYDNDLGISKTEYENAYRRGFLDGYDRAYRERRW